ncbi:MAG: hypothetical protein JNK04_00230 [Myxococcales bacterium]|nr:hypothetical protein [Myxococcales bacterium]
MKIRASVALIVPFAAFLVAGCPADEELTVGEAQQAVVEASVASQASNVAEGSIELTTSFTLGAAAEDAAEEIREFVVSQLPCAEVVREGATVTITYGASGDSCLFNGQNITGSHTVTVSRTDENDVLVEHTWNQLSNGRVEVSGSADVTWDSDAKTRHVVHELEWTRLSDGRTGTGSGDRLQSALDGAWKNGVIVDGDRAWDGEQGHWALAINDVEWRWVDPVPQSGSYELTTPANKQLTLTFERGDEDTIHVVVQGARRDFEFDVTSLGEVN